MAEGRLRVNEDLERVEAASRAVAANPVWYHTIELAPGVLTPGRVDLRALATRLLPEDMTGLRALDVGTFDGFWAFEMERRGARVVTIDVDALESAEWPPLSRPRLECESKALGLELGLGFRLAAEVLGSAAERVTCSVYDLSPTPIGGPVDFAFSGAILLHLRDPVRALERIRGVLRPDGELRLYEPVSLGLSLLRRGRPAASFQAASGGFNWWVPNVAGLAAYLRAAGFVSPRRIGLFRPPSEKAMRQFHAAFAALAYR